MRVLLTGATGHVGAETLGELVRQGQTVRCLVRDPRAARRLLRVGDPGQVEVQVGDVRDAAAIARAVEGQDVVLHLAALLPPLSDRNPELARSINVGGTRALLGALRSMPRAPKMVYVSTVALFGNTQALPPPRRVGDPIAPMDPYSRHKAECEDLLRATPSLTHTVLRLSAVPRFDEGLDPLRIRAMFSIAPSDRMECIHPADAAVALANACTAAGVWGRTLIIAGGPTCRMTMADYYRGYLDAMGVGTLESRYFSTESYHLDWYDTAESEALLHYQRHSFDDFVRELRRRKRLMRAAATAFRPLARRVMLHFAPKQ
jgi:nucleoside-diphosphate-sugar epimerase